ncbi:glucosaminidase domain-containing protein [Sphingobacterium sp. E70]|nr:glucosaminidase domain-containing protein [Sphingobacterium sp. E70]
MEEHGVPASVILAIAMHESGNGGSRIAKNLNNHFGVKGKNRSTVIRSAYKGYRSVLDSYDDFVGIVKRKKTTQSLFEKHPGEKYEAWVKAIARSGYSTSRDWTAKVFLKRSNYIILICLITIPSKINSRQQKNKHDIIA